MGPVQSMHICHLLPLLLAAPEVLEGVDSELCFGCVDSFVHDEDCFLELADKIAMWPESPHMPCYYVRIPLLLMLLH